MRLLQRFTLLAFKVIFLDKHKLLTCENEMSLSTTLFREVPPEGILERSPLARLSLEEAAAGASTWI